MTTGNVRPASMERITTPALAQKFIDEQIKELRAQIGDKKVLLALSGGVDSSVVAALLIKAVGKQLVSVHVNHGLLRKGEPEQVVRVFRDELNANLVYVDANLTCIAEFEEGNLSRSITEFCILSYHTPVSCLASKLQGNGSEVV